MSWHLINARLTEDSRLKQIEIDNQGKIRHIASMSELVNVTSESQVIDIEGDWLSLGGVDLQINGGLGLAFPDLEPEDMPKLTKICQFLWEKGVDGFLPTIVTTSVSKIARSLSTIADYISSYQQPNTAQILGVHLEGPFLNYTKRGAHPEAYLVPLNVNNVKSVLGDYAQIVKIMTLAPELDPSNIVIPYLRSLGITISLGHSLATAEQATTAFQLGATMVTHAFNAMPSLHHREPGLLGAAIINHNVKAGFIADGQHVCPIMLDILLRASNYDRGLFLVSDALAPIGLPDGVYPWDEREITVTEGTAKLADGTLSGTTLPLLVGVQNLVSWGVCEAQRAIALATTSPRQALGLPGLEVGQPATLLRWHQHQSQLSWERLNLSSQTT